MRLELNKTFDNKTVITIHKVFTDAPALYDFLTSQGFYIDFKDCVDDVNQEVVVYSMALEDQYKQNFVM